VLQSSEEMHKAMLRYEKCPCTDDHMKIPKEGRRLVGLRCTPLDHFSSYPAKLLVNLS
jgi:hypothetical protein